jgi:hypothetical protein
MKAYTEHLEANGERTEAVAQHCKWVPYAEAMHMLTALQDWASDVLHEVPKGATCEETIGTTEDHMIGARGKQCFLCGTCRGYIAGPWGKVSQLRASESQESQ